MAKFDPFAAVELQQLVAEYWYELDTLKARDMSRFYHEDCSFSAGTFYSGTGQEAVRKFYSTRARFVDAEKDGTRTTRHTYTNLKITFQDDGRALLEFVLINYSGAGHPPIADFTGPSMVTDVAMTCRRDADGAWKLEKFAGSPIFMPPEDFAEKFLESEEGLGAA